MRRRDGDDGAGWGPWGGILALLLTSMHMTLLGSLIGLAPGTLYDLAAQAGLPPLGWTPLDDQRIGGILMLAVGGAVYLAGGLYLMARALEDDSTPPVGHQAHRRSGDDRRVGGEGLRSLRQATGSRGGHREPLGR